MIDFFFWWALYSTSQYVQNVNEFYIDTFYEQIGLGKSIDLGLN